MADHSPASPQQMLELVVAVVRSLPRDIQSPRVQYWIEGHGVELKRALRQALMLHSLEDPPLDVTKYSVSVDYDLPIATATADGKYVWSSSGVTIEHFPTVQSGKTVVEVNLFHFARAMYARDVLARLNALDQRPAELYELLALGAQFPGLQQMFPIAELGSTLERPLGMYRVVCLFAENSKRFLDLFWSDRVWEEDYRFAAVCKQNN